MKKLIKTILCLFFTFSAFAQTPLEWQKISLEEKLVNKVRGPLSKVLKENQYVIEAEVLINDPGLPNFSDMTKTGLKVSDIPFDESRGDYIAFSKIGLEVPVIEKHFEDNQQKLKELHRFNETYNIFKNIEQINVKVFFSDKLSQELLTKAEAAVRGLNLSMGEVIPQLTFDQIDIEETPIVAEAEPEAPVEEGLTLKDILNFLSDFGNAFGLIMATLLFGFIAYKLLKLWEEIMQRLNPHRNGEDENIKNEKEEDIEDEKISEESLQQSLENFERFKTFLKNNQNSAVLLLKKWIRSMDESSILSLRAIAQQLSDEELIQIFGNLDSEMRNSWKMILDQFLNEKELHIANKVISEEVIRTLIEPTLIKDDELIDLVLGLSLEGAVDFVNIYKEEAPLLMNLLTPEFSGKVLDQVDDELATELIQSSINFDFSSVTDNFLSFKQTLLELKENYKKKPFGDKLLQMLPNYNPLKEKVLYEFLVKNNMKKEILRLATENIPSELILKLPTAALKNLMSKYSKIERAVFLLSLDEIEREKYLDSFAEKGSSLRDMINFDFEEVQANSALMTKIENDAEDIYCDFVNYVRTSLRQDQEFKMDVDMIVKSWIDDMALVYSKDSSTAKQKLHAI